MLKLNNSRNVRNITVTIVIAIGAIGLFFSYFIHNLNFLKSMLLVVILVNLVVVIVYFYLSERMMEDFAKYICDILEEMTAGNNILKETEQRETIESQVESKLAFFFETFENSREHYKLEHKHLQELISDISHQVKTPVATINSINETLIRLELPRKEELQFLKTTQTEIEKLNFLMKFLVDVSRLETGIIKLTPSNYSILSTIENAINGELILIKQKDIYLSVNCKKELLVYHDSKWTSEAIFNVLDNAVKYTPNNGKIEISVEPWGSFVKIVIADTGAGIPYEIQSQIFKRFFRGPNVKEINGLGIGLYLTRKIIMLQGGWIEVESAGNNEGSKFILYLPRTL